MAWLFDTSYSQFGPHTITMMSKEVMVARMEVMLTPIMQIPKADLDLAIGEYPTHQEEDQS